MHVSRYYMFRLQWAWSHLHVILVGQDGFHRVQPVYKQLDLILEKGQKPELYQLNQRTLFQGSCMVR